MEVIPHAGFDDILLGLSREQISEQLGNADRRSHDFHEDGERSEIWVYRMLRLELSFDSEHDYRLSHITSYHPYTLVRGFNPMGLDDRALLQKFPHLDLDLSVSDDEKYYSDRILDLTYGVARGEVVSVTVFPEYDERSAGIRWPAHAGPSEDDPS